MESDLQTPPPELERLVDRFSAFSRDQTMAALVEFAGRFPDLPKRFVELAEQDEYRVHECMTPVSLFSEIRDGGIYFYADVPSSAPTVRALLTIFIEALNGSPPERVLAIPQDFVTRLMQNVGLMTREIGLNAMVDRMKLLAGESLAS